MYEAFYGLNEKPFNLTPDPRFLYLSEKHKEAFAHLLFGIKNRSGFVVVTGEIGTGKTTICRTLLNQLDDDTEVAFIFNPCLSPEELLRKINEDFGIETRADSVKGLIDELNAYLLDRHSRGKNCVLMIDEAQNLTPNVLEQIRLLSNLETETHKLLQIVLIGQPELNELLALDELRQLDQRITARYHLKPLDQAEAVQYIAYRIRIAGGRRKVHFTSGAIKAVYRRSGGVPRVINALCDRALLIGYTQEVREITSDIVRRAAREVRGARAKRRRTKVNLARFMPNPTAIAVLVILVIAGKYIVDRVTEPPLTPPRKIVQESSQEPAGSLAPAVAEILKEVDLSELRRPSAAGAAPDTEANTERESLRSLLESLDPIVACNAAALEMLRLWEAPLLGRYPNSDYPPDLASFARENGLSHESLFATLKQLAALDLPVLTYLKGPRTTVCVGLVGLDDDTVRITTRMGETAEFSREEFEQLYLQQALVFWRDPTPGVPALYRGIENGAVRTLQQQLRAAGFLDAKPNGEYDSATVKAVRKLQADTGLNADGKAGRQTRMALCSWSKDVPTPSLAANGDTPPVSASVDARPEPEPTPESEAAAEAPAESAPAVEEARSAAAPSSATPSEGNDGAPEATAATTAPADGRVTSEELTPPGQPETPPAQPAPASRPPAIDRQRAPLLPRSPNTAQGSQGTTP